MSYKEGYTSTLLCRNSLSMCMCSQNNQDTRKKPLKELYVNHHNPEIYWRNYPLFCQQTSTDQEKSTRDIIFNLTYTRCLVQSTRFEEAQIWN